MLKRDRKNGMFKPFLHLVLPFLNYRSTTTASKIHTFILPLIDQMSSSLLENAPHDLLYPKLAFHRSPVFTKWTRGLRPLIHLQPSPSGPSSPPPGGFDFVFKRFLRFFVFPWFEVRILDRDRRRN